MNDPSDYLVHVVGLGYCRWCARPVRSDSFRDALSLREYTITAACQRCQDALFVEASDRDPPLPGSLRHGTIVGAVLDGASAREVALLPFEFVVRRARIEWEPRHIVRAGGALEAVDPRVELRCMRDAWVGHYLRILHLVSFFDPLLSVRLSTSDFVVGLDPQCLEVIGGLFPSVTQRPLADLSADVPWCDAFGVRGVPAPVTLGFSRLLRPRPDLPLRAPSALFRAPSRPLPQRSRASVRMPSNGFTRLSPRTAVAVMPA